METIAVQPDLFVKMATGEWERQNNIFNKLLASLSDEQLAKEIAPGKNTGHYLVGHLIAVSDAMLPILGFEEKLFPQLDNIFLKNPDKSGLQKTSLPDLKENLKAVNEKLNEHISSSSVTEWFTRHMAVKEEDFTREPHRNKLNVLINRASHMSYHLGQLALL
jgi:uncharacterized damage-inducible protein DinB